MGRSKRQSSSKTNKFSSVMAKEAKSPAVGLPRAPTANAGGVDAVAVPLPEGSIIDGTCSSFKSLNLNNPSLNGHGTGRRGGQLLISFSTVDCSNHYFYSTGLFGGDATRVLSLPGCGKAKNGVCQCHVSESVNGLFCFYNGSNVYVCNPTTRELRTLPLGCSESKSSFSKLNASINITYSSYSLGYDSVSQVFKILHIFGIRQRTDMSRLVDLHCEVYELKDGSNGWTRIPNLLPPYPYMFRSSQGVFVNGSIHWIGQSAPGQEVLVSYDVTPEKFKASPLPNGIPIKFSLTQIGGRLGLIGACSSGSGNSEIELWVREEKNSSDVEWVKKSVAYPHTHKRPVNPVPVGTLYSGDMLLTPSTLWQQYDLIACDQTGKNTINKVKTIRIGGLPLWTDTNNAKNINFRISNQMESFLPLPEISRPVESSVSQPEMSNPVESVVPEPQFSLKFGEFVCDFDA